ncbi:DUF6603 domain-containing protein [Streptomyces griseus]|uniref:DUF6603 domain-containing protein n=1 Tax=Streptomyces griseus TaxID=1911 RepID=UPI003676424A
MAGDDTAEKVRDAKDLSGAADAVGAPALPDGWGGFTLSGAKLERDGTSWIVSATLTRTPQEVDTTTTFYAAAVPLSGRVHEGAPEMLYVIGVVLGGLDVGLKDVPVLGEVAPSTGMKLVQVQLLVTTQPIDADLAKTVNALLAKHSVAAQLPAPEQGETIPSGAHAAALCSVGARQIPALWVDVYSGTSTEMGITSVAGAAVPSTAPAQQGAVCAVDAGAGGSGGWRQLLGPEGKTLRRVGVAYAPGAKGQSQAVRLLFDAAAAFGPVTLEFQDAGLTVPVDGTLPGATLTGFAAVYDSDPRDPAALPKVAGALRTNPVVLAKGGLELDGVVLIRTQAANIGLAASYAKIPGSKPSVFVFGELGLAHGFGPPSFTVNRLMLGGGYNSKVRLPAIDKVNTFPLLAGLTDKKAIGGDPSPLKVLKVLTGGTKPWITPQADSFWVAGGMEFEAFGTVDGSALLLVEFGNDWSVSLFGTVTAEFPQEEGLDPYARLEAEFTVQLQKQGKDTTLTLAAALGEDSYLVVKECSLTGGLALRTWLSGPDKGTTVFTAGGYAPGYKPQADFPVVPRIGYTFNKWGMTARAEAYFALVPRGIMAGGSLSLSQDLGIVDWWCSITVDIWGEWTPFSLRAHAGATVGIAADVNIGFAHIRASAELGIDLQMWWSPDFGGTFTAHLWFISFTGSWGAHPPDERTIDWKQFQTQIQKPLQIPMRQGLIPGGTEGTYTPIPDPTRPGESEQGDGQTWTASTRGFTFSTESHTPAATVTVNTAAHATGPRVNVRPMGSKKGKGLDAEHKVTISHVDGTTLTPLTAQELGQWVFKPVSSNLPFALWGDPAEPVPPAGENTAGLLTGMLTGIDATVPEPVKLPAQPLSAAVTDLETEKLEDGALPVSSKDTPIGTVPTADPGTRGIIHGEIAGGGVTARRALLAAALATATGRPPADDTLTRYAATACDQLTDPPLLLAPTP